MSIQAAASRARQRARRLARAPAPAPAPVAAPTPVLSPAPLLDDEPPFDPPAPEDLLPAIALDDEDEAALAAPDAQCVIFHLHERAPPAAAEPAAPADAPLPPLIVCAAWDRPEIGALFHDLAADPRCARAAFHITRGGFEAAIAQCESEAPPDLLLLDATLAPARLMPALQRLAPAIARGIAITVIGARNDVAFMRDLAARGVSEYMAPAPRLDELAARLCALYAARDASRVIAVVGARGGVGASSLAHNLAWSIATRHQLRAALVELDLGFGAAALAFGHRPARTLGCPNPDDAFAEAARAPLLTIACAPAAPERAETLDPEALEALIAHARRRARYVILDVPHLWDSAVRAALANADEVVIVAAPDLASLRNGDNIAKYLRNELQASAPAHVVLSMQGMPLRPEISAKDFAQALTVTPAAAIPFDGESFGTAAMEGRMLSEIAPACAAARAIDAFAARLIGRAAPEAVQAAPDAAMLATLGVAPPAPPPAGYLISARAAAFAAPAEAAPPPRRGGVVRAALAAVAVTALCVWFAQSQNQRADAAEPAAPIAASSLDARFGEAMRALAQGGESAALAALRPLADAGHAPAMHNLGVLYGRRADAASAAAAFRWFREAAGAGHGDSQFNLGALYEHGRGVGADPAEAFFWYTLAAARGDAAAAARAAALESALTPMLAARARARAEAFRPAAAPR